MIENIADPRRCSRGRHHGLHRPDTRPVPGLAEHVGVVAVTCGSDPARSAAFRTASHLARAFDAELLGLGTEGTEAAFRQAAADAHVRSAQWRAFQPDHAADGLHAADFVVTDDPAAAGRLSGIRPTLLAISADHVDSIGTDVLVVWDGSPAATAALRAARPLLRDARHVHVLAEAAPGQRRTLYMQALEDELAEYGIISDTSVVEAGPIEIVRLVREEVAEKGVDLLVSGRQHHSRAWAWLRPADSRPAVPACAWFTAG